MWNNSCKGNSHLWWFHHQFHRQECTEAVIFSFYLLLYRFSRSLYINPHGSKPKAQCLSRWQLTSSLAGGTGCSQQLPHKLSSSGPALCRAVCSGWMKHQQLSSDACCTMRKPGKGFRAAVLLFWLATKVEDTCWEGKEGRGEEVES